MVAFPTETVYGLGANAESADALARLAAVKDRAAEKPFAVLIGGIEGIRLHAQSVPMAENLARALWPGPLTLVLPSPSGGTVGLRMPDHALALALVRECRVSMAATSANRSGAAAAVNAVEVEALFGDAVDLILDGGPRPAGMASTVIEVDGRGWRVLRQGALPLEKIRARVGPERE